MTDKTKDNMVALIVTIYPKSQENTERADASVLYEKLKELPNFSKTLEAHFTMIPLPTMILDSFEVKEVYSDLANSLSRKAMHTLTDINYIAGSMAFPVRIYGAFDLSNFSVDEKLRFLGNIGEESDHELTLSECHNITGKELQEWENLLHCEISDLNWFLECKTDALSN